MEIGYGTLEDALAEAFGVSDGRSSAFASRLKYFGRLGFPAAARVGRGTRAVYGLIDVVQLAVAIELNDLGVPPVPMVHRIAAQTDLLEQAILRVVQARRQQRQPAFWSFGGGAVSARSGAPDDDEPFLVEMAPGEIAEWFAERRRADITMAKSMLVIDPQRLFDTLDDGFGKLDHGLSQLFRQSLGDLIDAGHRVRS